ncbi:MAG: Hsp70 family protein [Desulfobacterales bacterium]
MNEPVYIIGIDLGTTNSVVAYTPANDKPGQKPEIKVFEIPQLVASGTVEKRGVLPSFVFIPGKHDVAAEGLRLPWNGYQEYAVGEFARDRGAELPQRLISSSKSWLCNTMVDRNSPILPWDCPDKEKKKSPVEASSAILAHIRDAWNHEMATQEGVIDDSLRMENQEILLTVPASFDAVARDLTVKAAEMAGLNNITLLEEPQAAFYAWIEFKGDDWRKLIQKDDLILVCDIGGGTTDFSLINVTEKNGELSLERTAVGNHLLVGGDNMDLALAYSVAREMSEKGSRLDSWQMRGLWHSCRTAKEQLLSREERQDHPVTILGRGSSLIGGTIKTQLPRQTVEQVILEGFFPPCEKNARPVVAQKTGIREMGLVYESDPAVTHHLAGFLSQASETEKTPFTPSAILYNGGIMKSELVRRRIMEVINSWTEPEGISGPREIETSNFDLAVAKGAAYFGLARKGKGIRIRGGLNKSYYIGIAAAMPAVPGMPAPIKAICVGSFGMEEGTGETLTGQDFALVVGEPVAFDFLGSSTRHQDKVGAVVEDWEGDIQKITTMETTLDGDYGTVVPVNLEVKVTEIGTLELWCVSEDTGRRWKLEFNVREKDTFGTG